MPPQKKQQTQRPPVPPPSRPEPQAPKIKRNLSETLSAIQIAKDTSILEPSAAKPTAAIPVPMPPPPPPPTESLFTGAPQTFIPAHPAAAPKQINSTPETVLIDIPVIGNPTPTQPTPPTADGKTSASALTTALTTALTLSPGDIQLNPPENTIPYINPELEEWHKCGWQHRPRHRLEPGEVSQLQQDTARDVLVNNEHLSTEGQTPENFIITLSQKLDLPHEITANLVATYEQALTALPRNLLLAMLVPYNLDVSSKSSVRHVNLSRDSASNRIFLTITQDSFIIQEQGRLPLEPCSVLMNGPISVTLELCNTNPTDFAFRITRISTTPGTTSASLVNGQTEIIPELIQSYYQNILTTIKNLIKSPSLELRYIGQTGSYATNAEALAELWSVLLDKIDSIISLPITDEESEDSAIDEQSKAREEFANILAQGFSKINSELESREQPDNDIHKLSKEILDVLQSCSRSKKLAFLEAREYLSISKIALGILRDLNLCRLHSDPKELHQKLTGDFLFFLRMLFKFPESISAIQEKAQTFLSKMFVFLANTFPTQVDLLCQQILETLPANYPGKNHLEKIFAVLETLDLPARQKQEIIQTSIELLLTLETNRNTPECSCVQRYCQLTAANFKNIATLTESSIASIELWKCMLDLLRTTCPSPDVIDYLQACKSTLNPKLQVPIPLTTFRGRTAPAPIGPSATSVTKPELVRQITPPSPPGSKTARTTGVSPPLPASQPSEQLAAALEIAQILASPPTFGASKPDVSRQNVNTASLATAEPRPTLPGQAATISTTGVICLLGADSITPYTNSLLEIGRRSNWLKIISESDSKRFRIDSLYNDNKRAHSILINGKDLANLQIVFGPVERGTSDHFDLSTVNTVELNIVIDAQGKQHLKFSYVTCDIEGNPRPYNIDIIAPIHRDDPLATPEEIENYDFIERTKRLQEMGQSLDIYQTAAELISDIISAKFSPPLTPLNNFTVLLAHELGISIQEAKQLQTNYNQQLIHIPQYLLSDILSPHHFLTQTTSEMHAELKSDSSDPSNKKILLSTRFSNFKINRDIGKSEDYYYNLIPGDISVTFELVKSDQSPFNLVFKLVNITVTPPNSLLASLVCGQSQSVSEVISTYYDNVLSSITNLIRHPESTMPQVIGEAIPNARALNMLWNIVYKELDELVENSTSHGTSEVDQQLCEIEGLPTQKLIDWIYGICSYLKDSASSESKFLELYENIDKIFAHFHTLENQDLVQFVRSITHFIYDFQSIDQVEEPSQIRELTSNLQSLLTSYFSLAGSRTTEFQENTHVFLVNIFMLYIEKIPDAMSVFCQKINYPGKKHDQRNLSSILADIIKCKLSPDQKQPIIRAAIDLILTPEQERVTPGCARMIQYCQLLPTSGNKPPSSPGSPRSELENYMREFLAIACPNSSLRTRYVLEASQTRPKASNAEASQTLSRGGSPTHSAEKPIINPSAISPIPA